MSETVYSSQAELQHPSRFFADAWRDLRHSPPVAWQLFRSNVQARHRRTWLGYLWLLLPTLGTALVWMYVHSRQIVAIGATGVPYAVYALSGIIFWQVFSEALLSPLGQLTASNQLITRSRVPHEALILAGVLETLFHAAIRLVVLGAVMAVFALPVDAHIALVPLGVLTLLSSGLALGMLAAPIGLLYDDVSRALTMIAGFWFFVTPVVYPTPARGLLRFNPVSPLLETTRQWLTSSAPLGRFAVVTGATLVVLIAAWLLHRLARPHVVARLG